MNFTREPLVETVITPKEGYKLVIRSSKGGGQEEFFVDVVEVISFGNSCFFRSLEKPKCFLVPVSDYEVLEVRETRMLLKTSGGERGIKIGGGRETVLKPAREVKAEEESVSEELEVTSETSQEVRPDKRRERRRYRKKRGKSDLEEDVEQVEENVPFPVEERRVEKPSLIPPPTTLISETIARYKNLIIEPQVSQDELLEEPILPPSIDEGDDEEIPF